MKNNSKNMINIEKILLKETQYVERKLDLPKNLLSFILEGKRIRSKIINSSINSNSHSLSKILPSAIELTHSSSLIHDDIIDESSLRRGYNTAFSIMPLASASSIGYLLFSRLFLLMIRLKPFIYKYYFRVLKEMCIGQIMEIDTMHQKKGLIKKYLQTIRFKTGSLFAFCFGIKENRWNPKDASTGYKFGIAFQILDDLYDITLDENTMGKPTMQDAKRGIYTLPFLYSKSCNQNQITDEVICTTKNKALSILKGIDLKKMPQDWQDQFIELVNRINLVSCNISLENRGNSRNSQILNQI